MPTLSQEVQAIVAYITRTGIPVRVTATLGTYVSIENPCSPHSPGSYHCKPGTYGTGLAVDLAEPTASHDSPGLLRICSQFGAVESSLAELIYYDAPYCIKNGKRVNGFTAFGRTVMEQHRNHVHVAVKLGTLLVPLQQPTHSPTPGVAMPDYEVLFEPVSISITPSGKGYIILCKDGGVFAFGDAEYLGRVHVKP